MPAWRVVLAFPALVLLVAVLGTATGLNGFSSGAFHDEISTSSDPQLLWGEPREIRTDEWYVQTVWAIAQVEQGLPAQNATFPDGGMDATVPQDLPRADWSVAFRPHLWGFLVLDAGHAIAAKWWVLVASLLIAVWLFAITVLPRRPLVAAAVSLGFAFSPLIQWWFLATTVWPIVWAFATGAAILVAMRSRSAALRWGSAAAVAYLTVVMLMGIYVPYIVPAVLVVVGFGVGQFAMRARGPGRWRAALRRLVPLAVAALAAGLVTAGWLLGRLPTVSAFLGTAYPGERLTPTGSDGPVGAASTLAHSFTQALNDHAGLLGLNSSEASTFFYLGLFALPVVIWLLIVLRRRRAPRPWDLVGVGIGAIVLLAFMYLPGWDPIAHLLFLDRTTPNRDRIGLGIASLMIAILLVRELDVRRLRAPRWLAVGSASLTLLSQLALAAAILLVVPESLADNWTWPIIALLSAAAVLLLARRRIRWAIASFLALSLLQGAAVNPGYLGVLDLRGLAVTRAVEEVDAARTGTWVGIGGRLSTAVLLEGGVRAYNGFQGAPNARMWDSVDPEGDDEFEWNRLAGVSWTTGAGEPRISNPAPDQILVTFDACSDFARDEVDYVLSDRPLVGAACATEIERFPYADSTLVIYRLGARPSA